MQIKTYQIRAAVIITVLGATGALFQNMGLLEGLRPAKANYAFDDYGGYTGLDTEFPKQKALDIDSGGYSGSIVLGGARLALSSSGESGWTAGLLNHDKFKMTKGVYEGNFALRGKRYDSLRLIEANDVVLSYLNDKNLTLDQLRPIVEMHFTDVRDLCVKAKLDSNCLELDGNVAASRRARLCEAAKVPGEVCTVRSFRILRTLASHCLSQGLNEACAAPKEFRLNGHSSASFDPRFSEHAYRVASPSACLNAKASKTNYNPKGEYECYKLMLFLPILKSGVTDDGEINLKEMQTPSSTTATVVVKAFIKGGGVRLSGDQPPQIVVAQIDDIWRPLQFKNANGVVSQFRGYEMSTTADSRFLFFHHQPSTLEQSTPLAISPTALKSGHWQGFMFNPRPWDPKSLWTQGVAYQDMWRMGNYKACFGLTEQACNDDPSLIMRLADRYPVLAQQGRNPDGTPYTNVSTCGYPWVSFDGEEIFCTITGVVPKEDGRSSYAAFGRRTNWTWTVVDTNMNRVRGGCPGGGECHGILRSQSLGMTSGTWPVPKELNLEKLGIRRQPDTYILTLLGFGPDRIEGATILGFANFKSFTDGNYLGYFNFNELVKSPEGQRTWDLKHTPDVSGNYLQTAFDGGVKFFYDLKDHAPGEPRNNAEKWLGNSIYTNDGATITMSPSQYTPRETVKYLSNPMYRGTIEFAVKPMRDIAGDSTSNCLRPLVEKVGTLRVCLTGGQKISVEVTAGGATYTTKAIDYKLVANRWTHVSVRLRRTAGMTVNLFSHEDESSDESREFRFPTLTHNGGIKKFDFSSPLDAGEPTIIVGPRGGAGFGTELFGFDELKISRVTRSNQEIADSEFSHFEVPIRTPAVSNLPLGLDPADVRAPKRLAKIIESNSYDDVAHLGFKLFNDKNLSRDKTISCATCHQAGRAFTDGRTISKGIDGGKTGKNAPTIFNRAFAIEHMINQDKSNIAIQAGGPISNPKEMDNTMEAVITYLKANRQGDFDKAYGKTTEITNKRVLEALGAFMFSAQSGGSEMDRYLAGQGNLTSEDEILRGMKVFTDKGRCVTCHGMSNFSDELRHSTGVRLVKTDEDNEAFVKSPSMRNIASTAPYFHDGHSATLKTVVDFYSRGGDVRTNQTEIVATPLSAQEKSDLIKFLESLTGQDNRMRGN